MLSDSLGLYCFNQNIYIKTAPSVWHIEIILIKHNVDKKQQQQQQNVIQGL